MDATTNLVAAVTELQGIYSQLLNLLIWVAVASTAFTIGRAYLRLKDF